MDLIRLYDRMLAEYGPQHWWRQGSALPCAPCSKRPYFRLGGRKWAPWRSAPRLRTSGPADSRYEIVVGALLTQNTSWRNAGMSISRLKEAGALSPERILEMEIPELESLIRQSGFYHQKAERLRILTRRYIEITERMEAKAGPPPSRDELLSLKGVGPETADSILLYAFDQPQFVIDAYTRRFCAHHKLCKPGSYGDYQAFFESRLPRSVPLYKEYHALIVEWGKRNQDAGRNQAQERVEREMKK